MDYPGRIVEADDPDAAVLGAVTQRLAERGYPAAAHDGVEAPTAFTSAVKFFQATHADIGGRPLKVDGRVGPNTWAALFGPPSVVADVCAKALAVAQTQIGVREHPAGSNSGPEVDAFLASVGCAPGNAWCMAFVHWCFAQATAGGQNPSPASASVIDVLHRVQNHARGQLIRKADALADPGRLRPGAVFILDHGGGLGHTGILKAVEGAGLRTIEGNSNNDGSREGVGVFELTRRSLTDDELVGFIDFGLPP